MDNLWNYSQYEQTLQQETDLLSYLRLLKKKINDYAVFISVMDTGTGMQVTQELCVEFITLFKLRKNIFNYPRFAYLAVIERGNAIAEVLPSSPQQAAIAEGDIQGIKCRIYSGGFDCKEDIGCASDIIIDGKNYAYGSRGLNLVVLDLTYKRVVDSGSFDMFDGTRSTKMYAHLSKLQNFLSAHPNLIFFTYNAPIMRPFTEAATDNEKFIYINSLTHTRFLENLQEIWDRHLSPLCDDFEDFGHFKQAVTPPKSYLNYNGVRTFEDLSTDVVNTRGGIRVTTDQPRSSERTIFIVGPCTTFGVGAEDRYTIASYLQRRLNYEASEKKFLVLNYGFFIGAGYTRINEISGIVCSLPVKDKDIIILCSGAYPSTPPPHCDLTRCALNNYDYGELFFSKGHFTKNGNRMIADGLFEFLKANDYFPISNKTIKNDNEEKSIKNDESLSFSPEDKSILSEYKRQLCDLYKTNIIPTVGAVVMNCNPFTLGHRYLVEEALKKCDKLIVFVVEEDKSRFPFADRINLVKKNLTDLPQVIVVPSGKFVLSSRTFEEYFNKESLQDRVIDTSLDVTVFGAEIAPCMNISVRFVGEEPNDNVTRQYNETMKRILPQYGIEVIEIPRLKKDNAPVSASVVRQKLEQKDFASIKELVPEKTLKYLKKLTLN